MRNIQITYFIIFLAIKDVKPELNPAIKLLTFTRRPLNTSSNTGQVVDTQTDLTSMLEATKPGQWFKSDTDGFHCKLLYIYTSGTTGLPKAAVISPSRYCSEPINNFKYGTNL